MKFQIDFNANYFSKLNCLVKKSIAHTVSSMLCIFVMLMLPMFIYVMLMFSIVKQDVLCWQRRALDYYDK